MTSASTWFVPQTRQTCWRTASNDMSFRKAATEALWRSTDTGWGQLSRRRAVSEAAAEERAVDLLSDRLQKTHQKDSSVETYLCQRLRSFRRDRFSDMLFLEHHNTKPGYSPPSARLTHLRRLEVFETAGLFFFRSVAD